MKYMRTFFVLMILAFSGCASYEGQYTPQQQLGYNLLNCLKQRDLEKFKKLFSEKHVRQLIEKGAEKGFLDYQQRFYNKYGEDFQVDDFNVNFQGTDRAGKLYFFYKNKRQGGKFIIKQHGRWVFDEF